MKELDYHAVLTVYGLPILDKKTAKRLAKWLRHLADDIETDPKAYSSTFRARMMK